MDCCDLHGLPKIPHFSVGVHFQNFDHELQLLPFIRLEMINFWSMHGRRKIHDCFLLLLSKSSIWFTEEHIFKIILYFFYYIKICRKFCHFIWGIWWLIGQKILKLWRQESWPFGPGWSANIARIRSWTFRLPGSRALVSTILIARILLNFKYGNSHIRNPIIKRGVYWVKISR